MSKVAVVYWSSTGNTERMAEMLAERTRAEVVQVIGKKIVLYKEGKDNKKKIVLPEK